MTQDGETNEPQSGQQPAEVKTEGKSQADPRIILDELDKDTAIGSSEAEPEQCSVPADSGPAGQPRQGGADEMIAEAMAKLDEILVELKAKRA